jgi:CRP-like cAMP-binding protein
MKRSIEAGAEYKAQILRAAPFFKSAADEDVAELARLGRTLALQRGPVPSREGVRQVYVVQSGVCAELLPTPGDGKGLLTGLFGPGRIAGLNGALNEADAGDSLEALSNIAVLAIPASEFLRVCRRSPDLGQALGAALAASNERLARAYAGSLHHSLEKRLAELFFEIATLISAGEPVPEVSLGKLSQSSVAEMLGVSREHVNKTMSIWERSGLIFQNKKGEIFVENPKRLGALAQSHSGEAERHDDFLWEIDAHLDRGLNQTAMHLALEALRRSPKDKHYAHRAVLATARLGAVSEALALLDRQKLGEDLSDEDLACLRPRLLRDLSFRDPDAPSAELLKQSASIYESVFRKTSGAYPGVNAAEGHALAGDAARAKSIAGEVAKRLTSRNGRADEYWTRSTIAECKLLEGDPKAASELFARAGAASDATPGKRAMTRKQLARLATSVGIDRAWIDKVEPQPSVMYFCGPMAWGTAQDAIPTCATAEAIHGYLSARKVGWAFGALASGADIIAAEALLDAGASLNVYLPLPPAEFVKESVPSDEWRKRYFECLRRAESVDWNRRAHSCNAAFVLGAEIAMGKALRQAQQLETDAVGFFATQAGRTARNSHSIQNMMLWSAPGNPHVEIAAVWPPRPNGGTLGEPQTESLYYSLVLQESDGAASLSAIAPRADAVVSGDGLDFLLYASFESAFAAALAFMQTDGAASRSCWLDAGTPTAAALKDPSALAQYFITAANRPLTDAGKLYASDAFASAAALVGAKARFEYVGYTPTREKIDPCALYLVQA